jgi:hypothetical protein
MLTNCRSKTYKVDLDRKSRSKILKKRVTYAETFRLYSCCYFTSVRSFVQTLVCVLIKVVQVCAFTQRRSCPLSPTLENNFTPDSFLRHNAIIWKLLSFVALSAITKLLPAYSYRNNGLPFDWKDWFFYFYFAMNLFYTGSWIWQYGTTVSILASGFKKLLSFQGVTTFSGWSCCGYNWKIWCVLLGWNLIAVNAWLRYGIPTRNCGLEGCNRPWRFRYRRSGTYWSGWPETERSYRWQTLSIACCDRSRGILPIWLPQTLMWWVWGFWLLEWRPLAEIGLSHFS